MTRLRCRHRCRRHRDADDADGRREVALATGTTLRGRTVCVRVMRHRGGRVLQLVGMVRLLGGIVVALLLRSGAGIAVDQSIRMITWK